MEKDTFCEYHKRQEFADLHVREMHKYGGLAHQVTKTKLYLEDKMKYTI